MTRRPRFQLRAHVRRPPATLTAALCDYLRSASATPSALHTVLDDANLRDSDLFYAVDYGDHFAGSAAVLLMTSSPTQRRKVYALSKPWSRYEPEHRSAFLSEPSVRYWLQVALVERIFVRFARPEGRR